MDETDDAATAFRFRSNRTRPRPNYRRRHEDLPYRSPTPSEEVEAPQSVARGSSDGSEASAAALAALRSRVARKARFTGVGFSSESRRDDQRDLANGGDSSRRPDGVVDEAPPSHVGIADRFTHQTGLIADLNDKHISSPFEPVGADRLKATMQVGDQPAKHGRLLEVVVPATAHAHRNEISRRRAEEQAAKPRRGRKRRASDDMKRDQLVEKFLHENRLEVYDQPEKEAAPPPSPGADVNADERMAEQFRRQYLDEVAQRRQRRRPAQPARPPTGDVLKGPKLGGSRNARAAVRDALLKQEKEKAGRTV